MRNCQNKTPSTPLLKISQLIWGTVFARIQWHLRSSLTLPYTFQVRIFWFQSSHQQDVVVVGCVCVVGWGGGDLHKVNQRLNAADGHAVVDGGTHASHGAVPLQLYLQPCTLRTQNRCSILFQMYSSEKPECRELWLHKYCVHEMNLGTPPPPLADALPLHLPPLVIKYTPPPYPQEGGSTPR